MKKIKKIVIVICFALSFIIVASACGKKGCAPNCGKDYELTEKLIVILHAGGEADGLRYLNAQETFKTYYDLGFRYFEYDLKLSTDGRLIGSHAGEHLNLAYPESLTYEQFKTLKLSNGYTPVNEEWLIETILAYPDVKIVVDAKMEDSTGDAKVLERIEQLESIYNCDISSNIIPEIFTSEMWEIASKNTTFDEYFFSHYKVYYSISKMLNDFSDDRIWGIALPIGSDNYIKSNIYRLKESGKEIFFFTPTTTEEVLEAVRLGARGVYADTHEIIPEQFLTL